MRCANAFLVLVLMALPLPAQPAAKPPESDKKTPSATAKPEANPVTLTVVTKTGSQNKFARANGIRIYVLINGNEKHKTQLRDRRKNIFETGATDTFRNIPVTVPLEEIESIRLAADGEDMWKCETISFQFFQKGLQSREYKFTPARYLSTGKERKAFTPAAFLDFKLPAAGIVGTGTIAVAGIVRHPRDRCGAQGVVGTQAVGVLESGRQSRDGCGFEGADGPDPVAVAESGPFRSH